MEERSATGPMEHASGGDAGAGERVWKRRWARERERESEEWESREGEVRLESEWTEEGLAANKQDREKRVRETLRPKGINNTVVLN